MFQESTSGTTGTPLDVWSSSETLRMWFALYESRIRRWNGTCRSEPWAILGGQPVVPTHVKRPPYWVWNAPMNQLYLSANHLSRRNAPAFIEGLNRYQVTHMVAYTSSAVLLAKFAMELGLQVPGLKVLMTNAESLFPWQRETIKRGLQCRVRETYGMAETVAAASECSAGRLHLWPEVGWLEVLPNSVDRTTRLTETGRLICTSLLNADMPLVRYELGDQVRLPAEAEIEPCSCGRKLPVIGGIEGRTNDVLIARDGRHVYWLNPVFYGLPVQQAQIIQETIDHIIVRFIPDNNFSPATVRTIVERVKASLGDVEVTLDAVDEIARSANGKFRAVVSRISADASTCMDVRA
jgi:phenylacetate-CoA ligase